MSARRDWTRIDVAASEAARDACQTENCDRLIGGPRDRNGFCADCADAIEEQDREHDMEDCQ